MTVLGVLKRVKAGNLEERHVIVETITAPNSDVTIAAAGTATITISIAKESPRDVAYAGVQSITGLPANVYIAGISLDKANKTITITLYNADTANAATVSAGSLTIEVVAVS